MKSSIRRNFTANDLTAFVFTNGRSTLPFCLKTIREQSVPVRTRVIQNKTMVEAIKEARAACFTPFLLKVDDDFFLHPKFIEFALRQMSAHYLEDTALFWWHLWELWSQEVVQSVKIYHVGSMWDASFNPDIQGRIDLVFLCEMKARCMRVQSFQDVVGAHSCGTQYEQQYYIKLWKKQAPRRFHNKAKSQKMMSFNIGALQQHSMFRKEVEQINVQRKTEFNGFLHATEQTSCSHYVR
jgi:hypothetical protein